MCSRLGVKSEDVRLWKYPDEFNMTLLEDPSLLLEDAGFGGVPPSSREGEVAAAAA